MKTDLFETELELFNGQKFKIYHNIGDMIEPALDNWLIRVQTRHDEPWFKNMNAKCFCMYIESKDPVNQKIQ